MTTLHSCRPTATVHHLRQPGTIQQTTGERAAPRSYYVAELLGVLPEPLPLELAEAVADTLAIDVDAIGTVQLPDERGASRWAVFRVHMTFRSRTHAEVAALGLAQELGEPTRACILADWQEPAAARRAGGAA